MGVKVITPASNILTLAQLRLQVGLPASQTDEDALLQDALATAVQLAEHYTGTSIGAQTLELALDAFPSGPLALKQGPVTSIESIKYLDSIGVEQTLPSNAYLLDDYGTQHWAIAVDEWPDTGEFANAVKVRYMAGSVPPAVVSALKLTVAALFADRENGELSPGACRLLDTVKVYA